MMSCSAGQQSVTGGCSSKSGACGAPCIWIFMTLGMVLGLYGLLYLEVARRPAAGFAIAAVGLAGKLLGPAGWLWLYLSGQWPLASGMIILTNDLLWWFPFALYLRDSWPAWRATG